MFWRGKILEFWREFLISMQNFRIDLISATLHGEVPSKFEISLPPNANTTPIQCEIPWSLYHSQVITKQLMRNKQKVTFYKPKLSKKMFQLTTNTLAKITFFIDKYVPIEKISKIYNICWTQKIDVGSWITLILLAAENKRCTLHTELQATKLYVYHSLINEHQIWFR